MSQRIFLLASPTLLLCTALGLGLCACASEEKGTTAEVRSLVDHGRYDEAVRKAAAEAEAKPGDAAAQTLYKDASVAFLLEKGRRLTFKDADVEALHAFHEARAIEPDSKEVRAWIDKTNTKLARRNPDDRSYQMVLQYHVTFPLGNVVLVLIGLPLLMHHERRRGARNLAAGSCLCILYFATDFVFRKLGLENALEPKMAAWMPILVFGSLGIVLFDSMKT